jgi:hypothetical protein
MPTNETEQDRQCVHNVTLRCVRVTIGKAISIKYYEGVSAFLHLFCAILYCHLWLVCGLAVAYFSTLSPKLYSFDKKKLIEHKMCVLIVCTTFVWDVSTSRRIQRDIIINVHRSSCKVPVILLDFNETWFSQHVWKIPTYQIPWKSIQWEQSCSMWIESWMDKHDKDNRRFLQFCKQPKYSLWFCYILITW